MHIVKATAAGLKNYPRTLDVAALEGLIEPLTIQVARIKGSQFSPIPLPPGADGGAGGIGWTKGEVIELNSGWLVNHWSGGGEYLITVTDSNQQTVTWRPWWSPQDYPERVPPTLMEGARANLQMPATGASPVSQPVQPSPGQVIQMPLPTLPPSMFVPTAAPQPMYQPHYQPYQAPQPWYGAAPNNPYNNDEKRRMEERLAAAEQQLLNARLEAEKRNFEATLERERAAHRESLARMEQKITEFGMQQKAAPNNEIELLKTQLENERREREAERRDREHREAMQAMNQQIQVQIQAMQAQQQTLLAQAQTKGPDPMIQLMMEQNRNSMEAMKEIARQSSTQIEKMQNYMMNPRDMIAMQREAASMSDSVTKKMADAYGSALDMHGRVLEQAMTLNQGGSPVVELIEKGIGNVKDLAERYVTSTNRAKAVEAQAVAAAQQAQAQAQAVQAQANAAIAQAEIRARQMAQAPVPAPVTQPVHQPRSNGLGGTNGANAAIAANANAFEEWKKQRESGVETPPKPRETASVAPRPTPVEIVEKVPAQAVQVQKAQPAQQARPRTDIEWFGPALDEVNRMREAVDSFLVALGNGTAVLDEKAATAENVARSILIAASHIEQHRIPVPAVSELLGQGNLIEFMQLILPKAPEVYHHDVIKAMLVITGQIEDPQEVENELAEQRAEAASDAEEDEDDDDETDSEDGSPSDNVRDGAPAAKKPTIRVVRSPARA